MQKNTQGALPTLSASDNPIEDIQRVSYPGQPAHMHMYKPGYERYLEMMPVVVDTTNGTIALDMAAGAFDMLADELEDKPWIHENMPKDGAFDRTIIGIEAPTMGCNGLPNGQYVQKEGKELVVARWGTGYSSPVHGHSSGLILEKLISGAMMVNTYRMVDDYTARPQGMKLHTGLSNIVKAFNAPMNSTHPRPHLIHNFVSLGPSVSVHYVPEHTRDGRDNTFKVEWFEQNYDLKGHVTRLTTEQALLLQPGAVALVRSGRAKEYKDHFIVIKPGVVSQPYGVRQNHDIIPTSGHVDILDYYNDQGFVFLLLDAHATNAFMEFHDMVIEGGVYMFDDHRDMTVSDVSEITTLQAMSLRLSDVILVRSKSLPHLGDHYAIITGHSIMKPHGLRPQMMVFPALQNSPLLDVFDEPGKNAIILKLSNSATQDFMNFYGLRIDEGYNISTLDEDKLVLAIHM